MLSPDDRALVERDAELPGLAVLLDTQAFAEWLAQIHPPEGRHSPARAEALYVRYKRGTSCIALFDIDWPDHSKFVIATCYRTGAADKIAKARAFAAEQPSIPAWIDGPRGIVAHAFPADRELPALARLHSGPARERILHKMFGAEAHDARITSVLRYKPERRFASVWNVAGQRVVLKAYSDSEFTRALKNALTARTVTPAPIATSERHRLIAWTWLEGTGSTPADMPAVAAALSTLHHSTTTFSDHATPDLIGTWTRSAAAVVKDLEPNLGPLATEVAAAIQRHINCELRVAPLHGDCSLEQCIRTPAGVTLIDFDNAVMGPPELDLGNLAAKCLLTTGDRNSTDAVLDAFAGATSCNPSPNVRAFIALGLLRAATDVFRKRGSNWTSHLSTSLDHACEVLHAL